jgi:5'-methylthioinosine phosphorylase
VTLAIIGGTGVDSLDGVIEARRLAVTTPWGNPSGALVEGHRDGRRLLFLQRHGEPRSLPPHRINYRANLWALRDAGASAIVAINAVGGISAGMNPGDLVIPDQLIDYTWGRAHSFDSAEAGPPVHIEFTEPYDGPLRAALLAAAVNAAEPCRDGAVLGVTQGPRLETAAEIRRLARDGCDLVGMTAMPEAALARELALPYASVCMVVNAAAGLGDEPLTLDAMRSVLARCAGAAGRLIGALVAGPGPGPQG